MRDGVEKGGSLRLHSPSRGGYGSRSVPVLPPVIIVNGPPLLS